MERKAEADLSKEKQKILQLIVFRVGDEEFGVPIEAIQEIIKTGIITPIPDSPEFIKGLINVRGDIVAVIDIRARFFLVSQEIESKHIVIAKQGDSIFGLMVGEVIEVLRIQDTDIKPPPHLMTKIHEDYVHGVITHEGRLIILLDLDRVLSEEELVSLAKISRDRLRLDHREGADRVDEEGADKNRELSSQLMKKKISQRKKK